MTSNFDLKGKARELYVPIGYTEDSYGERQTNDLKYIRYIEYAAYEKLRADLDVAKDALAYYAIKLNREYFARNAVGHDLSIKAREALAKLGDKPEGE